MEKGGADGSREPGEEEAEEEAEEEKELREQVTDRGRNPTTLHPPASSPLQPIRSHSSARSHISYTDGYTHFGHDHDEEGKQKKVERVTNTGEEEEASKEFEVRFDGDADPYSPKNRSTGRKWSIVLILSASSLCVTCASALYTVGC